MAAFVENVTTGVVDEAPGVLEHNSLPRDCDLDEETIGRRLVGRESPGVRYSCRIVKCPLSGTDFPVAALENDPASEMMRVVLLARFPARSYSQTTSLSVVPASLTSKVLGSVHVNSAANEYVVVKRALHTVPLPLVLHVKAAGGGGFRLGPPLAVGTGTI